MISCKRCFSYAINHHSHGRDGTEKELCDVCYWRQLAEIRLAYLQLLEKNVDILKPRIKQLEQALESITKQVPAQDGGGFFCLRFDGEGNEIGIEYIDPMTIVSKMYSIAIEAIETKEAKL